MSPYTAVIIATKDRPQAVSNLLDALALQTVLPDVIVVSACDPGDIEQRSVGTKNVEILFGSPGLPAQRNRALSSVRGKSDIVIFFDDDFIPSRYWIEHVQMLMATQPDIVCVTGNVLMDGVKTGEIKWSEGQSIVDEADASKKITINNDRAQNNRFPYGCNMAFRAKSVRHLTFDERLVLYGWLEDRDFSSRAGARMMWTDSLWGVHLGAARGRDSGIRFGYSQIVNPWYLMKKGVMKPFDIFQMTFRAVAGNAAGIFLPNSRSDRRGRLKGNIIGIADIIFDRWAPERAAEL
jgi:glycosyltransferase involved in cell wall biosynthesis